MVYYLEKDIVEVLKTGHEHDDKAYKKVKTLLFSNLIFPVFLNLSKLDTYR